MYDNTVNNVNNANNYTNRYVNSGGRTDNNFGALLATMMRMNMNNSLRSIGDFSNTGSSRSNSSDAFGMNNSLYGMNGSMGSMGGMSNVFGMSSGLSALSLLSGLYGGGMSGGSSGMLGSSGMSGSLGGDMMMLLSVLTLGSLFQNYSYSNAGSGRSSIRQNQAVNAYNTTKGALVTPTEAWKETSGGATNVAGRRNASLYKAVVDQFNVAGNGRYKPRNGDTFCNIFVWDATRAMGAEIPHYTNSNGDIVNSTTKGAKAMNVNSMVGWLRTHGERHGWKKVSAEEAQNYANRGMPAVVMNHNSSGGHTSMVIPSPDGKYHADKGVRIAQAGSKLTNSDWITNIYSSRRMKEVEYWVHA